MKLLPPKTSGFTLVEVLLCVVVLGVLVWMLVPQVAAVYPKGQMSSTLSNARQLHLATQTMQLDTFNKGGNGMEWTMLTSDGRTTPVSLAAYFDALVKGDYLSRADLRKLVTAPGKKPSEELTADTICFHIFQINEVSPANQPFVVTANWEPSGLTKNAPYGKRGFVVFSKGGTGGVYTRSEEATDPEIFPTGSRDGRPFSYVTLK